MEKNSSSVVDTVLAETPAAARGVFLDSAGSSLPPRVVTDTVVDHLRREAEIGGYAAAAERADDLLAVRGSVGRLLGAPAHTIALSDSATRAWQGVSSGYEQAIGWARGLLGGPRTAGAGA